MIGGPSMIDGRMVKLQFVLLKKSREIHKPYFINTDFIEHHNISWNQIKAFREFAVSGQLS